VRDATARTSWDIDNSEVVCKIPLGTSLRFDQQRLLRPGPEDEDLVEVERVRVLIRRGDVEYFRRGDAASTSYISLDSLLSSRAVEVGEDGLMRAWLSVKGRTIDDNLPICAVTTKPLN
jgi:hypothetical protein